MRTPVVSSKRHPDNYKILMLTLKCGHEIWHVGVALRAKAPKTTVCPKCAVSK